jgi:arginine repressor
VGLVLDGLNMTGLVGTLAGDDTVFVASDSGAAQKKLIEFLETRMAN